jgi:large subunit ribosomal protein L9
MAKEVMLMSDVPGLGIEGDLVKVADGYARNYLLPRQLAAPVTAMSRRQLEVRRNKREERLRTEREQADVLATRLAAISLTLPVKAGPEGKLYGSVGTADIAEALAAQGMAIDRHKVVLKEPLKELGVYDVAVKLHPERQGTVKVWIVEE